MVLSVHELLAELVRRPSVNPMGRTDLPAELCYEHRVADYLVELFEAQCIPYQRQELAPGRFNLLAEFTPEQSTGTLLWEAHMDTVPVDGMTIEPFAAKIVSGRLQGRGACDVKGGLAAMVAALLRLHHNKPRRAATVLLACNIDEEHTFLGVQACAKQLKMTARTIDFGIVAEPTGLNIVEAHKGIVRWQLSTHGRACHSSRPEDGSNAIYAMAKVIQSLQQLAQALQSQPTADPLGPPTLNVGMIHGGLSANTVADFCQIDLERRLVPGESVGQVEDELKAWITQQAGNDFKLNPASFACPPLTPAPRGLRLAQLRTAIDAVAGSHTMQTAPYATDASMLAELGFPVVVFGPGDISEAHTKAESIPLVEVTQAVEILLHFACA